MVIREAAWQEYVDKLAKINSKAAKLMQIWIDKNGLDDPDAAVRYAYELAKRYGEAAAALACEAYDAAAIASGVYLPAALPAATATFAETAKAVYGTLNNRTNTVPATVSRLVKQAGADTTLQNARRDGAQFAWIPHGETCAFCIMLASNGWQYMSSRALKNGHAEHIHANCDCQYAVRFDDRSEVAGYNNGAAYKEFYYKTYNEDGEIVNRGGSVESKLNAMRREIYAAKKRDGLPRSLLNSTVAEEIDLSD